MYLLSSSDHTKIQGKKVLKALSLLLSMRLLESGLGCGDEKTQALLDSQGANHMSTPFRFKGHQDSILKFLF